MNFKTIWRSFYRVWLLYLSLIGCPNWNRKIWSINKNTEKLNELNYQKGSMKIIYINLFKPQIPSHLISLLICLNHLKPFHLSLVAWNLFMNITIQPNQLRHNLVVCLAVLLPACHTLQVFGVSAWQLLWSSGLELVLATDDFQIFKHLLLEVL